MKLMEEVLVEEVLSSWKRYMYEELMEEVLELLLLASRNLVDLRYLPNYEQIIIHDDQS